MGYLRRWKGIRDEKLVSGVWVCWRKQKYLTFQEKIRDFFLTFPRSEEDSLSLSLSVCGSLSLVLSVYLSISHLLSLPLSLSLSLCLSLSPSLSLESLPPHHSPAVPTVESKLVSSMWSRVNNYTCSVFDLPICSSIYSSILSSF